MGPDALAMLLSSIGFGAMGAGLWLAQRGETQGLTRLVTWSMLMSATAVVLFAMTNVIWLAAPLLMVMGFFMLLGGIACQTLILCGRQDQLTPLRLHRQLAEAIPNSRLVVVDFGAHLVMAESAIRFNQVVAQFLDERE